MCGIAGYASRQPQPSNQLELMAGALRHRGPDSGGFHQNGSIGLAVRRLRVIDLVTGDQPITSSCSGATIVYNGELYNYRELRAELQARGHDFRTKSDTEVVLHFYEEFGVKEFGRLNGMFAFAIDDPRAGGRMLLARDHLGVKPLYYMTEDDGTIYFASEIKALERAGVVKPQVSRRALAGYLTYGHSTPMVSFFSGVMKLPPAHALSWSHGKVGLERYWNPISAARCWNEDGPTDRDVEELIADSVNRQMIADVPVGVFLSGGVDSSLVAALMRRLGGRTHTYSVGFGEARDELGKAARVAAALGTEHVEIAVSAEDALRAIDDLVEIYDEPFADAAAVPTYVMSLRARQDVTVVLTGEGGDELFGGYRRYLVEQAHKQYSRLPRAAREFARDRVIGAPSLLRRLSTTLCALTEDDRSVRYATWTETFSRNERRRLLGDGDSADAYDIYAATVSELEPIKDDVVAMMAAEVQTWLVDGYLEKVDKATMAASLEARVPLLDPRLVELLLLAPFSEKRAGLQTKIQLRRIAKRYLPAEIARQPKRGFTPPIREWLLTTMRGDVEGLATPDGPLAAVLDAAAIDRIVTEFRAGGARESQVWSLLMLDRWLRNHAAARLTVP